MKMIAALIVSVLCLTSAAYAQKSQAIEYDDFELHKARATTHDGSFVSADRSNVVSFDVSVSGTATVLFRVSGAGKYDWKSLACYPSDSTTPVTETSESGFYQCNTAGADVVSARLNACESCSVSVVARRTTAILGGGGGGGVAGWPGTNIAGGITWAGAIATAARIGNGTDWWALGRDPTDGLYMVCVVAGVVNDCNYIRKLAAGKKFELQNSAGTPIGTFTESTGVLSNVILVDEQHWEVAACQNVTAQAVYNLPTANAPTPVCEGTNTRLATLDFNDTTDQSFHGRWKLPPGFQPSLGIDIHGVWKGANTTNAAGWCFQMVRVPDGATSDPAQPAQASGNCVSDTAKGTTLQENTFTISNVTCTSCVAGDSVNWIFSRDANGGAVTDSFVGDAKLLTFGRTWRIKKQ